jgi:signal transduction histidine kinase
MSDEGAVVLPLKYQSQHLGKLHIAPREPGERYPEHDLALMRDIAASLSLAAHNALLRSELQQSRDRAVNALEDERRRLRRDLHDGLGPTLASLTLNLDAIQGWLARLRRDTPGTVQTTGMLDTVDTLIDESRGISTNAMSDVRRAINNLRPSLLDDLGLVGALERHSERINADASVAGASGTPKVRIRLTDPLPVLPAGVEVAAFRIVMEALTNAMRHARAATCTASIGLAVHSGQPHLRIEVADDGAGMPEAPQPGIGIAAMRDRAQELGGELSIESTGAGTRVIAQLPLPAGQEQLT